MPPRKQAPGAKGGPDIVEFITGPRYLGKTYFSPAQMSVAKAIYGIGLSVEEREAFREMSEGREPRAGGYDEVALVIGTRGGKTDLMACIECYESLRLRPMLSEFLEPGENAIGILIAADKRQAGKARGFVEGNFLTLEDHGWNILDHGSGQEKAVTGQSVRLMGQIEIVVFPANRYSVRGSTGLWFGGDEIAWWESAEGSYNQDTEVMRAVRTRFGTLSRLKPKRLLYSSPNTEQGVLWDAWSKRWRSRALVLKAPTWVFYPGFDEAFLIEERERDPEGFDRDYGANFQKPGGSNIFLPARSIEQCIETGRQETPPEAGREYVAWIDAAFKRDRFCCGAAHGETGAEAEVVHVDLVRCWTPQPGFPLDDKAVVKDIVETILRPYGIDRVHGDQFADIPLKTEFARYGIGFIECPTSNPEKHAAYVNLRAALRAKLVRLPDEPLMVQDLKGLISRKTQGGLTWIGAPKLKGAYDDAATVVSRLVMKLLPMASRVDLEKLNAGAIGDRDELFRRRGLPLPEREDRLPVNIMAEVY